MKFITTVTAKVLILGVILALPAQAVQASTLDDMRKTLQSLQTTLSQMQASRGVVLGANSIVVATPAELAVAISAATGGETIRLKPGNYGDVTISNASLLTPATITSDDLNNRAVLSSIYIKGSKWRIQDLSFRGIVTQWNYIISTAPTASDVVITRNDIASANSENASSWTPSTWLSNAVWYAIGVNGARAEVSYNYIKNVRFGIVSGNGAHIHHNKMVHLAGDALRAFGPNDVIEHNYVANNYQIDANHNDLFQSFTSTEIGPVTIRNNTLLQYDDKAYGIPTGSQGIGLFDGFYKNWLIENNLVVIDHWHGISLYGSIDSIIRNNVSLDPNNITPGGNWINFFNHKNGTPTVGGQMLNNYSNSVMVNDTSTAGVVASGNVKVLYANYGDYFVDHLKANYTIKPGAINFTVGAIIDSALLAPEPFAIETVIANPPTVTLASSASTLVSGNSATLTWSSTDTTSCTASDAWSGTKSTVGSESTGVLTTTGTKTYTLSCSGTGGTATQATTVTVTDAPLVASTTPIIISPSITSVLTNDNLNVREKPNGKKIGLQPKGATGVMGNEPAVAKAGHDWVYVNFTTGVDGYVAKQYLDYN